MILKHREYAHLNPQDWLRRRTLARSFLKPGRNCWRRAAFTHAAVLVDCAAYYRALHSSIVKARHSIFIIGWDIDSRIRLLRGADETNAAAPSVIGNLLGYKAEMNPRMNIHLLRWDSSFLFLTQRELLSEWAWSLRTPENVHILLDTTSPIGGSHHQKIVIIDDEIAYTGGMDIARERWDECDHNPENLERHDPGSHSYGPYHDVQAVIAGPAVRDFARLARQRWEHAAGYTPLPVRNNGGESLPHTWPDNVPPDLHNGLCGIARTLPPMNGNGAVYETQRNYLDAISRARRFIYAENQFFSCNTIAAALNRQLKQKKELSVLLVSSFNPQGILENAAFWSGRMEFMRIATQGVDPARIALYSPAITSGEKEIYKRIHSKVMTVDDDILIVASSNLNTRSMRLDTECDLVIAAKNDRQRTQIAAIRNGLIAEHSGMPVPDVAAAIQEECEPSAFLGAPGATGWHLRKTNDAQHFINPLLRDITLGIADPSTPIIPPVLSFAANGNVSATHALIKKLLIILSVSAVFILITATTVIYLSGWIDPGVTLRVFLESYRNSPWALPIVCLIYIAGGLIMFPVTLLSLITAAVFGAVLGSLYAMCGALLSGALLFWIGRSAGFAFLRRYTGEKVRSIGKRVLKSGVMGVVVLRLLPIAPYGLVNLALGVSTVPFKVFMIGTFLGLLPGLLAKGLVGDSLMDIFLNPSLPTLTQLALGILAWIALIAATQRFVSNRLRATE